VDVDISRTQRVWRPGWWRVGGAGSSTLGLPLRSWGAMRSCLSCGLPATA